MIFQQFYLNTPIRRAARKCNLYLKYHMVLSKQKKKCNLISGQLFQIISGSNEYCGLRLLSKSYKLSHNILLNFQDILLPLKYRTLRISALGSSRLLAGLFAYFFFFFSSSSSTSRTSRNFRISLLIPAP